MNWLNATAIIVAGESDTWAEVLGFATGLACVWLVVREHVANWPVGIANVVLLMVAFWTAGLYADAGLQIVYVILGAYGWWQWTLGRATARTVVVRRTTTAEWLWLAAGGVAATGLLWWLLAAYTPSTVPFLDAFTTALSLVATYGQCRKLVEQWWFWIAADIVYIPLYAVKHLPLTTVLYAVFLGLSVIGLRSWRATLHASAPNAPRPATVG